MSPTFFQLASQILQPSRETSSSSTCPKILDNLGGGDCAIYAFILGELHLAKNHEKITFINKWKKFDPSVAGLLDEALTHEVDFTLARNRAIMDPLKDSMRRILKDYYIASIPKNLDLFYQFYLNKGKNNIVYEEFYRLCEWARCELNPRLKRTADLSPDAMQTNLLYQYGFEENFYKILAKKVVHTFDSLKTNKESYPSESVLFDKLVFAAIEANHDRFSRTYERILTSPSWLTESQLHQLADLFEADIFISNRFFTSSNITTFTHLINKENFHWVTELYDSNYQYPLEAQSLEAAFSEALDSVGYLYLQRFIQNEQLICDVFSVDYPQFSEVYARLNTKLTDLFAIFEIHNLPELLAECIEQEKVVPISQKNNVFKNILRAKSVEKKHLFLDLLDGDRTFCLFSNVVEAKQRLDRNPSDAKLQNELMIEKLRLLSYIDEENLETYQARLEECLRIRALATPSDKEEISELQKSLRAPLSVSSKKSEEDSTPYYKKNPSFSYAGEKQRTPSESEFDLDDDPWDDVLQPLEPQQFPFHIYQGALGGAAVGAVVVFALSSFAHITVPALLIIGISAMIGMIVANLIKLYADSQQLPSTNPGPGL
jgi:hypothetical protein